MNQFYFSKRKKKKERIVKAHCSAKSHRRGSEAHVFHICLQALSRCQQNTVTSCVKSVRNDNGEDESFHKVRLW